MKFVRSYFNYERSLWGLTRIYPRQLVALVDIFSRPLRTDPLWAMTASCRSYKVCSCTQAVREIASCIVFHGSMVGHLCSRHLWGMCRPCADRLFEHCVMCGKCPVVDSALVALDYVADVWTAVSKLGSVAFNDISSPVEVRALAAQGCAHCVTLSKWPRTCRCR